jgi:hypothetical protein
MPAFLGMLTLAYRHAYASLAGRIRHGYQRALVVFLCWVVLDVAPACGIGQGPLGAFQGVMQEPGRVRQPAS